MSRHALLVLSLVSIIALPTTATGFQIEGPAHPENNGSSLDRVTYLNVDGVPLRKALTSLSAMSGVALAYSPDLVPAEHMVSCDCEGTTVREALIRLLDGTALRFAELGKQVVIEPIPEERPAARRDQPGSIRGLVVTRDAGAPIASASVSVQGTRLQTVTNGRGEFLLTGVPAGDRVLIVGKIGYRAVRHFVTVPSGGTATAEVSMQVEPISIASLIVQADTELPTETNVLNFPAARDLVSSQALRETGAVNTEELLQSRPGILIQDETGTGSKPNIGVRGLDPRRSQWVAILVDDVPLEPAPYGHTGLSIFPYLPERTEAIDILRGGVAVRHGPNTVGGVINLISNRIPVQPQVSFFQAAGSNGYLSHNFTAGNTWGNTGLLLDVTGKRGNGYRQNGDFKMFNYNVKLRHAFNPSTDLSLSFDGYNEPNVGLPGGLSPQAFENGIRQSEYRFDYFDGYRYGGSANLHKRLGATHDLRLLSYAYTTFRGFGLQRPNGIEIRETPRRFWVYAVEPRYSVDLSDRNTLTVGARFMYESAAIFNVDYPFDQSTGAPTGAKVVQDSTEFDIRAWSFYADKRLQLSDRLIVYPGVRFEVVDYDAHRVIHARQPADMPANQDFTELLPGGSVVYRINENLVAFGNYHRSFRAPQYVQMELNQETQHLQDLGAERGENVEAGIRVGPSSGFYGEITAFNINFDNRVERDNRFENVFRNIGATQHTGVETRVVVAPGSWLPALSGLETSASYTYVDAKIKSGQFEGNKAPNAPDHRVSWRARYAFGPGLALSVDGLHVGSAFSNAANAADENATGTVGPLPSYDVLNAGVMVQLPRLGTELSVFGRNITNETYFHRDSRGRLPAVGRTWLIQARQTLSR